MFPTSPNSGNSGRSLKMSGAFFASCLLVKSFLWILTAAKGDDEVSCVFMESCILPCSFQGGTNVVIHWFQMASGDTRVHSYSNNQDQLAVQDKRFKNRTSLFRDQISGGNASLQLTGVKIQDQGRYRCFTSTLRENKDSFINLKVDALVRKVDIQQVGSRISCSSEGIYPEPQLTWTTNPPSNLTLQNKTTVHQTDQQLYNINSSLIVSDLDNSCTVSTRRNKRTATLFKPTSINVSNPETTIPCTSRNTPLTSLIWRFNHSQIILNQTGTSVPCTVSEEWRQQVKSVSESGSLTLQDLSSNQEGTYTCELSDDDETYVKHTNLKIIEEHSDTPKKQENINIKAWVIVLILAGLLGGLVAFCIYKHRNRICPSTRTQRGAANAPADGQTPAEEHEMVPMAGGGQNE